MSEKVFWPRELGGCQSWAMNLTPDGEEREVWHSLCTCLLDDRPQSL